MFDQAKMKSAIETTIKSWLVPRAREMLEAGEFVPTAFLFTDTPLPLPLPPCFDGDPDVKIATMILSDQPGFHSQEHKDNAALAVTIAARRVQAWGVLMVCDTDYWNLYPDAHELLGMDARAFKERAAKDYDWLCGVRDQVGEHREALSFQFETYFGDWAGVLVYQRDEAHGFIWHPLAESEPDSLQREGRFSGLLPPPVGTEVGHA